MLANSRLGSASSHSHFSLTLEPHFNSASCPLVIVLALSLPRVMSQEPQRSRNKYAMLYALHFFFQVLNVSFAFELMQDGGLEKPKPRPEGTLPFSWVCDKMTRPFSYMRVFLGTGQGLCLIAEESFFPEAFSIFRKRWDRAQLPSPGDPF